MTAPLRIGYLIQQFPPEVGAGPARAAEMALRWRSAGAEVTVITGMPNRPQGRIHPEYRGALVRQEMWNGIRVLRSWLYVSPHHSFPRTAANNASFMATSALHAALRCTELDVLVASSPPFFVHCAGEMIRRLRRLPLILEIRDLWPDYLVGMGVVKNKLAIRQLFSLERFLLAHCEAVVVVTDTFRDRVMEKGVLPERIGVIPNGVDLDFYFAAREQPPLPELERRNHEFIIGYLGNFGAGQRLSTVLHAAARFNAGNVRFVLAGDGADRAALVAEVRQLGLEDRVTIREPLPKERTRAFYNACDACLVPLAPFPVLQQTIPSKLFEIMACERPVIGSLEGEGARIIRESGSGIVCAPGEPAALANAVTGMIACSRDERICFGSRGRAYVARHYDRALLADRYLDLLKATALRGAGRTSESVRN